jgi:hypothetical protein
MTLTSQIRHGVSAMPDPRPFSIGQLWGIDTRPDPAWEEAKRRLWAMSADERRAAMYEGRLSLRLCLHWASRAPREVPLLDGEWWFIAIFTPEIADAASAPFPASSDEQQP